MLTHQQKRLYDFIVAKIDAEGVAPTFVEMQAALGISSRGLVHRFVGCLEERGFIRRIPARARAIEVIRRPEPSISFEAAFVSAARSYLTPDQFAAIAALAHGGSGIADDIAKVMGGVQ